MLTEAILELARFALPILDIDDPYAFQATSIFADTTTSENATALLEFLTSLQLDTVQYYVGLYEQHDDVAPHDILSLEPYLMPQPPPDLLHIHFDCNHT